MLRKLIFLVFFSFLFSKTFASSILIPMDAKTQTNHLKAYGITYWLLEQKQNVQWLLNYRGGSFLVPSSERIERECLIRGVTYELISDSKTAEILQEISTGPTGVQRSMRRDRGAYYGVGVMQRAI